jgi:hypothetical protein
MVKTRGWVFFIVLMLIPVWIFGQVQTEPAQIFRPEKVYNQPRGFLNSLLGSDKFSMSHSYSMSIFTVGNQTFNQGLYLSTMNFNLSDPLFLQVRVGYSHQPFGGTGLNPGMNGKVFLQRALLQYKPLKNMTVTLDYQQMPSRLYYPYSGYYRSYMPWYE